MKAAQSRYGLALMLLLAACMACVNIGRKDLSDWDESRNGSNAWEMYHNHDYINLYYAGEPDSWNAKPPLMIWLIVGSYHLFGFNELALRLPAVMCALLFLVVFYRMVRLADDRVTAFFSCFVLLSCKAVMGDHIGTTGDFDALLLVLLTASASAYLLYMEREDRRFIYLAALCTGLAFYAKGPAALLFLPGFLLYACLKGKVAWLFGSKHTWLALLLTAGIIATWPLLLAAYGKTAAHSVYGSKGALETMLLQDTFHRLTSTSFREYDRPDPLFFFTVLDTRMNLWNYFFYGSGMAGLWVLFRHRRHWISFIRQEKQRLVLYACCLMLPVALLLTLATSKHNWYLAPVFGCVAILTVKGIRYLGRYSRMVLWIAGIVLAFALGRHFLLLATPEEQMHRLFSRSNPRMQPVREILFTGPPRQSVFLYLQWLGIKAVRVNPADIPGRYHGALIIWAPTEVPGSPGQSIRCLLPVGSEQLGQIQ